MNPPEVDENGFPNHGYFIVTIASAASNHVIEQLQRWHCGKLVEVISFEVTINGIPVPTARPTCH